MAENDLKLDESVFRFLFTSPAYFVGECSGEGFYLTPAFQSFGRRRNRFDPSTDGSTFVLAVRAEPSTRESVRLETYEWVGEEASALLGAFYGKLIQNLGHIQCGNISTVPTGVRSHITDKERTPFNSQPRKPDGPA